MSDQPVQPTLTTAAALTSFRLELIEGGFSPEEAAGLAHAALVELAQSDGLHVRVEVAE